MTGLEPPNGSDPGPIELGLVILVFLLLAIGLMYL